MTLDLLLLTWNSVDVSKNHVYVCTYVCTRVRRGNRNDHAIVSKSWTFIPQRSRACHLTTRSPFPIYNTKIINLKKWDLFQSQRSKLKKMTMRLIQGLVRLLWSTLVHKLWTAKHTWTYPQESLTRSSVMLWQNLEKTL